MTEDLEGVRITVDDLRPQFCARGIRKWFDDNNLDMRDFLINGIDAKVAIATGDARVMEILEKKINGQRRK